MTIVAAYQPRYFPRLHYLARARRADLFVVYDDVEFCRRTPQHRMPIDHQGQTWLTLPVTHTGPETRIVEADVDTSEPWPATHLDALVETYGSPAKDLRPYYSRWNVSIVEINALRDDPASIKRGARSAIKLLVDDCLGWDERWRQRKRRADELRQRKGAIADEIADRKRSNADADVTDLVGTASEVDERLEAVESQCRTAKTRRNEALVKLSVTLGDSSDIERAPPARLWELNGIDPTTVLPAAGLTEVTVPLLEYLFDGFAVETPIVRSSALPVDHPGDPSEYLARLTAHLDGEVYLSGEVGYTEYLDEEPFAERGLEVAVQDWTPSWDDGNVCALDVLFSAADPPKYVR